ELLFGVVADAVGARWGDVGRINRADRRCDRIATRHRQLVGSRSGVASGAVACDREIAAALDLVLREQLRLRMAGGDQGKGQSHSGDMGKAFHAASSREMASALLMPSAAMVSVELTTLAEGMAPPPGSQRLGWS